MHWAFFGYFEVITFILSIYMALLVIILMAISSPLDNYFYKDFDREGYLPDVKFHKVQFSRYLQFQSAFFLDYSYYR
jgi:hypothetical protein